MPIACREYVAGVNFYSDQQDKAVDLFLEMLKEDKFSFWSSSYLGNLFAPRGEVERAIRIHQSLMESAALSFDQRLLAVQQLGRDYVAAGVCDRAENIFQQLIDEQISPKCSTILVGYLSVNQWLWEKLRDGWKLVKLVK